VYFNRFVRRSFDAADDNQAYARELT